MGLCNGGVGGGVSGGDPYQQCLADAGIAFAQSVAGVSRLTEHPPQNAVCTHVRTLTCLPKHTVIEGCMRKNPPQTQTHPKALAETRTGEGGPKQFYCLP